MLKVRFVVASLGLALILPAASTLLAQTASIAPAAPLPSQILTAKKVFISNAGVEYETGLWKGGSAQPYNELYAAIKGWGQYEIVAAPADADLVFQISLADSVSRLKSSIDSPQIELLVLDPKTHIVLWTLGQDVSVSHLQIGRNHALEEAIGKLIGDLKALTSQPAPAAK
jgi:hypothetical protein